MAQTIPNEPTQDAIDQYSLAMIREARRVKDKKHGELQSAYKTADLRGLNTDAGKKAIQLVDGGYEAINAFFEQIKKTAHYLVLLGKDLSPDQYEMFGDKRGPAPEEERATVEGRAAGFDLDPEMSEQKIPYDAGSVKGQAWLAAFRQGRSERDYIMNNIKPPADEGDDGEGDGEK